MKKMLPPLMLFLCLAGTVRAQAPQRPSSLPQEVDRIVAVVNDEVITRRELQLRFILAIEQLKHQGTQLPPQDVLEKQMLERMVMDKVQMQFAQSNGLRIDDVQLEQAIQRIAAANKLSPTQLREALQRDGVPFGKFREEVRTELTIGRIREREVEQKIAISEGDVDNYLNGELANANSGTEYEIAHILLRTPESASPEQIQRLKAKADLLFERLKKGEDFAQMAASYSDAPDGLKGGSLGLRPLDRLPSVFSEAATSLKVGELAPVLRSPNGFHLVKLLDKRGGMPAMPPVEQTHVRHILIKVNELVSETDAQHKLADLRERLQYGAKFAELARLHSQDGTAAKGGDLGWVYPGDTVPEFERVMNQLPPGEVSQPIRSPFGFHLIEVLERRVQDVSAERKRDMARQALRERKVDEAYQDWLRQARDRAYVEIRLEER